MVGERRRGTVQYPSSLTADQAGDETALRTDRADSFKGYRSEKETKGTLRGINTKVTTKTNRNIVKYQKKIVKTAKT